MVIQFIYPAVFYHKTPYSSPTGTGCKASSSVARCLLAEECLLNLAHSHSRCQGVCRALRCNYTGLEVSDTGVIARELCRATETTGAGG
ncbi:hypothetical protein FKM82_023743 [Ascaphus truei]